MKLKRKLLKKQGFAPEMIVTDRLSFHGAARRGVGSLGSSRVRLAQEQSRGRLSSGGATTRVEDAGLQISRISSAVPLCSLRDLQKAFNLRRHLIYLRTLLQFRTEAANLWHTATSSA
jgi:putative transposase